MDLEDNILGLTPEQTDKILQFQDLTGIEDMSICRDVLQRHQWDLEVSTFSQCISSSTNQVQFSISKQ